MIKAVIFDMDGVIIDSEPLWEKAERILLSKRGVDYNPKYRDKITGLNQNASARLLKETFRLQETAQELIAERIEILLTIYDEELEMFPGVIPLLRDIKSNDLLLALASSSPLRVINVVLDKFSLSEHFPIVVSGEFIEFGKPNPDIYLLTAIKLGVKPCECIVIEDSINGIKSAKDAGMYCVAIPDKRSNQMHYKDADLVIDSLDEINFLEIII